MSKKKTQNEIYREMAIKIRIVESSTIHKQIKFINKTKQKLNEEKTFLIWPKYFQQIVCVEFDTKFRTSYTSN